jgi:signal transduction histidine kinase
MPWRPRERAIQRFTWLLVGLWLPVVTLIAVITWSSSRSTFEPLERLASQAEALSVQNLSSRLEIESGEYAEFARRLNRFLDRLEMSVRREERFVSDAAHELRTPLTVMRGRLETNLLRDRTEAEYKDTLQGVLVETERLSGLVEMLLQSATLVDKAVMPLDLQEQVEKTHARWVDRFDEHNIELQLESDPCSARIRAREFEVVADNLLSNALKASPFNTTVRLKLEHDHAVCRLHVSDEGPGVPPEARAAIFERFARLDPGRNRDSGGFGIGLAVCKRIVDERGGTIFLVDSERGAHFVVEFPSECE